MKPPLALFFTLFFFFFFLLCARTVVIVMDMEILQSADETGGKIGNPTPYNKDGMVKLCVHSIKNSNKHFPQFSLMLFVELSR